VVRAAVELAAPRVPVQNDAQKQLCVPAVRTEGESFRMREAKARGGLKHVVRPLHPPHEEVPAED
jgi:hypothetical protein